MIRLASEQDLTDIKRIANQNRVYWLCDEGRFDGSYPEKIIVCF